MIWVGRNVHQQQNKGKMEIENILNYIYLWFSSSGQLWKDKHEKQGRTETNAHREEAGAIWSNETPQHRIKRKRREGEGSPAAFHLEAE